MIDIKDLQIGDWVMDGKEPAQVTILTCDGIIETTSRVSNIEVIEPISITPEILDKNGFEKRKMYYVRADDGFELWYYPHLSNLRYEFQGKLVAKSPDGMNYVHQLQHFLHLCGINKTIKL